ncbi:MAG: serine hydroxymethyltransferase [Alphaproteobacteria bacterium]|nr:serine hydroxymethyltransferase [Alphaproteobacteria bacterium]
MAVAWETMFGDGLAALDPEISGLIDAQRTQNAATVNLVASETYCPRATLEAEASVLVNKNASGYPPRRSVGGGEILDRIELLACERARRLFGAEHANIQALSSTLANVAVVRGLLRPGDRILSFDAAAGGHGSHGGAGHLSGQDYVVRSFGVDERTGLLDLEGARRTAREFRPHIVIAGSSSYPRAIDFAAVGAIAAEVGALTFADIAHVAGLIVAGLHANPTPHYDVVTTSTHKTLCGPRTGGLILCRSAHAAAIDAALMPGLQAAPGAHIIAARAALFALVARPEFTVLMRGVVANARALAEGLREGGAVLYCGGTDTHMVVVDLRGGPWSAADLNARLLRHGIVASTTGLPADPARQGRLGLRVGTTAMTIRGAGEPDLRAMGRAVAHLLAAGPAAPDDPSVAGAIAGLAGRFPVPAA